MKRSEALRPLSRDHHQALVVAQRLSRDDDVVAATSAFLEFWEREGEHHFRVEEELLLPLWALLGTVDDVAAARLAREHLAIRSAALGLSAREPSLASLRNLGKLLAAHVRFEERELFAQLEADLDPDALERLARAVSEAEHAQRTKAVEETG